MDHGQTIDENGDVVTIVIPGPITLGTHLVLVDDLETVVVDIALVNELDILRSTVIATQQLDLVFLEADSLVLNTVVGRGDARRVEG